MTTGVERLVARLHEEATATAPIHDHGAWAVIGILLGRERETRFRTRRNIVTRARHRYDPGTGAATPFAPPFAEPARP